MRNSKILIVITFQSSLILEIPLSLKIIKFCHRPFYLETKYDGEHLLLHRFEYTRYNYYTRNGIDYTYKMGATNEMLISKRIHNYFKSNVRDCARL
jgi:ATP-dependent DNA ligase